MVRRYSTRSRRPGGSATAEPAVGGLVPGGAAPAEAGVSFESGEFRARLDRVREACATPGRVVVLSGPADAGKSVLCEALSSEIEPPRSATSVCASAVESPYPVILEAILGAYGFKVEADATPQVMAELIGHHAADPGAINRQCVVIVDDAHVLPTRDLHSLLSMVDKTGLTLVLAGPPNLAPVIERVAQPLGLDWCEVQLDGLAIGDVNAYLQWRQSRDRAGSEATARPAARAVARSSGRGGSELGQGLQSLMARLRSLIVPAPDSAPGPFGFPRRHLTILAALLVLLIVVYGLGRIVEEITTTASSTQRVETLDMPPLPSQLDETQATDDAAAPARLVEAPEPQAGGVAEEPAGAAPRAIISRPAPGAPASTRTEPDAAPIPAPAVSAEPREAPALAPAPSPAQASTPAPEMPEGSGRGSARGSDWILTQPGASYTLQLVSLSSADRVRAYIARQPDPGAFATYRLLRNGQLFHVVLYGSFPTKAQADQAARQLPGSVGNVQPWVRQFSQVQENVRATPQQ